MRFSVLAVLLAAFAFLAIGGSFSSAAKSHAQVGRSLRVTETHADTFNAEDRGFAQFVLADLKAKLKLKDWRINTWLTLGRTDEQVMKTLGIPQGLARADLKNHPKFNVFERFQVKKWLKEGTSPSKVWGDLGLKNVAGDVMKAAGYTTYTKYVWALGNKVVKYNRNGGIPPTIHKIEDPVELAQAWAILRLGKFNDFTIRQIVGYLPLL